MCTLSMTKSADAAQNERFSFSSKVIVVAPQLAWISYTKVIPSFCLLFHIIGI